MHIDDVIKEIKLRSVNRTRYVGQPPFIEELIVDEIDKLRAEIERLRDDNKCLLAENEKLRALVNVADAAIDAQAIIRRLDHLIDIPCTEDEMLDVMRDTSHAMKVLVRDRLATNDLIVKLQTEIERLLAELEEAKRAAYAGWCAATGYPIASWVFEHHPWLESYKPTADQA